MLVDRLNALQSADILRRSHLFEGRYENLYLNEKRIPQITRLRELACQHAAEVLGLKPEALTAGCWLNDMPPGSVTLTQCHDDDDELLSGVYYIDVPEHSGHLVLHHEGEQVSVTPEAGKFVFFSPAIPHEVTRNASTRHRLSLGFNFGPARI